MKQLWRHAVWITLIAIPALLVTSVLFAGSKYRNLYWEAEEASGVSGRVFKVGKYADDPSGKVSGNKVLYITKMPQGEKVPREEVKYTVKIPEDGTYYLWVRTYWSTGCGNSYLLQVSGYGDGEWLLGGDGTYNSLHWVCLSDGGDNNSRPRPLRLKKGTATFTLISKESGAKADQFLLTTDRKKEPAGIYTPTADVLVKK